MNAITAPLEPAMDWDAAARSVNAWRGSLLQCFASAEAAVSETLAVLASCDGRGEQVRLRLLVGQRFQDLQDALDPGGPFAADGASAAAALRAFRRHEQVRTVVAHGCVRIALDRRSRWIVELRFATFSGRELAHQAHLFEQDAAETLAKEVRRLANRLSSKLQTLRSEVVDQTPSPPGLLLAIEQPPCGNSSPALSPGSQG